MQLVRIVKKFRIILSKHQRIRVFELSILMVVGAVLELCSVTLILPFMEAVLDPQTVMNNRFVDSITRILGIRSYRTFLVFLALILALIYIIKNAFLLFNMNVQNRFVYNNQFETQKKLLHDLLLRPYEFFLGIDSGEILRVITNDTSLTYSLLTNVLMFFSEMVVSIALVVSIFIMAPFITVVMAAVLLVVVLIIMSIIRPFLERASLKSQGAYSSMNKWLLQAIQGIKEIKIMRKEGFFEEEYNKAGRVYVRMNRQTTTLSQMPRFIIEAASMSSFLVTISYMIYKGMDLERVIPILSAIAMAAIRILPSINRISSCMSAMAAYEPYLDKMIENLKEVSISDDNNSWQQEGFIQRLKNTFGFYNICYSYPSGNGYVFNYATMMIEKGQSIGIVGASGAGKTTAIDILLGLLRPQNGSVIVDGKEIFMDWKGWLSQVGYIPQSIFILDGSIRANVAFGISDDRVDDDAVWKALEEAALLDYVKALPDKLDTELGERGVRLSGGQRQRIGIARALYFNPSVLFFDEATSALDGDTESAIMESINSLQGTKTLVIIAHRISTIEKCDHIFRVENGSVIRER